MLGIFDSGVGGLSVLKELKKQSPQTDVVYFGDIKNAPYGIKSQEELKALTALGVKTLLENGATNILSACNSVSAFMALEEIGLLSDIPFGVVEMINPTVEEYSKYGDNMLLFATPATIESNTYQKNFKDNGVNIKTHAISELAGAVEFGASEEEFEKIINEAVSKALSNNFESALLCCTHYPFVKEKFEKSFNDQNKLVKIFDPAETVVKTAINKFNGIEGEGTLRFLISKDSPNFRKMAKDHFGEFEYTIEVID